MEKSKFGSKVVSKTNQNTSDVSKSSSTYKRSSNLPSKQKSTVISSVNESQPTPRITDKGLEVLTPTRSLEIPSTPIIKTPTHQCSEDSCWHDLSPPPPLPPIPSPPRTPNSSFIPPPPLPSTLHFTSPRTPSPSSPRSSHPTLNSNFSQNTHLSHTSHLPVPLLSSPPPPPPPLNNQFHSPPPPPPPPSLPHLHFDLPSSSPSSLPSNIPKKQPVGTKPQTIPGKNNPKTSTSTSVHASSVPTVPTKRSTTSSSSSSSSSTSQLNHLSSSKLYPSLSRPTKTSSSVPPSSSMRGMKPSSISSHTTHPTPLPNCNSQTSSLRFSPPPAPPPPLPDPTPVREDKKHSESIEPERHSESSSVWTEGGRRKERGRVVLRFTDGRSEDEDSEEEEVERNQSHGSEREQTDYHPQPIEEDDTQSNRNSLIDHHPYTSSSSSSLSSSSSVSESHPTKSHLNPQTRFESLLISFQNTIKSQQAKTQRGRDILKEVAEVLVGELVHIESILEEEEMVRLEKESREGEGGVKVNPYSSTKGWQLKNQRKANYNRNREENSEGDSLTPSRRSQKTSSILSSSKRLSISTLGARESIEEEA